MAKLVPNLCAKLQLSSATGEQSGPGWLQVGTAGTDANFVHGVATQIDHERAIWAGLVAGWHGQEKLIYVLVVSQVCLVNRGFKPARFA